MPSDHRQLIREIEEKVADDEFDLSEKEDDFIQRMKKLKILSSGQDEYLQKIWRKAVGQ